MLDDDDMSLAFPVIRVGGEWRPQPRIGISLFGNLGLGDRELSRNITIDVRDGATVSGSTEMEFFTVEIPAFTLEAAFSFYF